MSSRACSLNIRALELNGKGWHYLNRLSFFERAMYGGTRPWASMTTCYSSCRHLSNTKYKLMIGIHVDAGEKIGSVRREAGHRPFGKTEVWSRRNVIFLVWATCANANHQRRTNKYFAEVSLMRVSTTPPSATIRAMSI